MQHIGNENTASYEQLMAQIKESYRNNEGTKEAVHDLVEFYRQRQKAVRILQDIEAQRAKGRITASEATFTREDVLNAHYPFRNYGDTEQTWKKAPHKLQNVFIKGLFHAQTAEYNAHQTINAKIESPKTDPRFKNIKAGHPDYKAGHLLVTDALNAYTTENIDNNDLEPFFDKLTDIIEEVEFEDY